EVAVSSTLLRERRGGGGSRDDTCDDGRDGVRPFTSRAATSRPMSNKARASRSSMRGVLLGQPHRVRHRRCGPNINSLVRMERIAPGMVALAPEEAGEHRADLRPDALPGAVERLLPLEVRQRLLCRVLDHAHRPATG